MKGVKIKMLPNWKKWSVLAITLAAFLAVGDGLAVMSIDFGSEYFKVAIVKPGVPMEIALNFESRRKTPIVVSMRNGERLFSDPAMNVAVRFPSIAYQYLQDLLAKGLDNPVVQRYKKRFPYYNLVEDPETKHVVFQHNDEEFFTPEELIAMVLEHAKHIASTFAEQPVTDAVITVPPYYNQAERRAMLRAADIAGIKVLQLMNDNTATALQYGIFRRKEFNATATHFMYFDMGATSTYATIVSYQEVKEKNKITGTLDKFPQLQVRGVGFNRNLGGLEFQLRLRDHLAKLFNEQKKTPTDVTTNQRSMAKLFKEAGRLKNVLSANAAHMSQIENVLDDQDFKAKVTRTEFEEMCADLFDEIEQVVKDALTSSEFTMEEISEVILMGGGTRMPKVQEKLQKAIGREELGKSINTDEAAALGAVYQAAHLSKGFKVKKFGIKEATIYPIVVEFERAKQADGSEPEKKMVTRTLFGRNNGYPQKKVMTFNKHVDDFEFEVNYGDVGFLNEEALNSFGSKKLQKISLEGVADAYGKYKDEADSKGVKAHFKMEESGIIELDQVEFVFERPPIPVEETEEKSTLEKIGNAFGSLFGGSEPPTEEKDSSVEGAKNESEPAKSGEGEKEPKEDARTKEKEEEKKPEENTKKNEKATEEEKVPEKDAEEGSTEPTPSESDEPADDKTESTDDKTAEEPPSEQTEEQKTETSDEEKPKEGEEEKSSDDTKDGEKKDKKKKKKGEKYDTNADKKAGEKDKKAEKEKKEEKPKNVTLKAEVLSKVKHVDVSEPSTDTLKASKNKIKELKKKDEEKALLEKAQNELETFIIDTQDKIYQDDYIVSSLETEREEYSAKLSAASDWLYDQEEGVGKEPYIEKLGELKKMTKELYERVRERQERPRAIEALKSMLNYSEYFLVTMKNFTGKELGEQPFTQVEYDTLSKLINSTKEWNETQSAEQAKTPDTEKPKMMIEDFARKINDLDREVKYLVNKAKTFKPKPPPKTDEKKSNTTKTKSNETKTEEGEAKTGEKIVKDTKDEDTPKTEGETQEGEQTGGEEKVEQSEEGGAKSRKKRVEPEEGGEEEVLELEGEAESTKSNKEEDSSKKDTEKDEKTATHNPEEL